MITASQVQPGRDRANRRRALALATAPSAVAIVLGFVIAFAAGGVVAGAVAGAAAGAAVGLIAWSGGARLAISVTGARAAGSEEEPRVHNVVEGLCALAGLPKPAICVIDNGQDGAADSFSVGRSPRTAVLVLTRGMLGSLNRMELEAVVAHELSHIKAGDVLPSTVAVSAAGIVLSPFPAAVGWMDSLVGPRREWLADLDAVSLTRYPPALIAALEKVAKTTPGDHRARRRGALAVRATSHLWLSGSAGAMASDRTPTGGSGGSAIEKRIEALREL